MKNDMERFCLPSLSFGRCSSIAELGITYAWEQARRIENKEKLDMALEIYRREPPRCGHRPASSRAGRNGSSSSRAP